MNRSIKKITWSTTRIQQNTSEAMGKDLSKPERTSTGLLLKLIAVSLFTFFMSFQAFGQTATDSSQSLTKSSIHFGLMLRMSLQQHSRYIL